MDNKYVHMTAVLGHLMSGISVRANPLTNIVLHANMFTLVSGWARLPILRIDVSAT